VGGPQRLGRTSVRVDAGARQKQQWTMRPYLPRSLRTTRIASFKFCSLSTARYNTAFRPMAAADAPRRLIPFSETARVIAAPRPARSGPSIRSECIPAARVRPTSDAARCCLAPLIGATNTREILSSTFRAIMNSSCAPAFERPSRTRARVPGWFGTSVAQTLTLLMVYDITWLRSVSFLLSSNKRRSRV